MDVIKYSIAVSMYKSWNIVSNKCNSLDGLALKSVTVDDKNNNLGWDFKIGIARRFHNLSNGRFV